MHHIVHLPPSQISKESQRKATETAEPTTIPCTITTNGIQSRKSELNLVRKDPLVVSVCGASQYAQKVRGS